MDDPIYTASPHDFPFPNLALANPHGLQGGAYFSRLKLFEDKIFIQMPKCQTKNGIHKTEKKIYCDLMFTNENVKLIEWANQLENKIKNLIFEKRRTWFHSDMDLDTIEYHWQPILRTYKRSNRLLRCFLKKPKTSLAATQTVQIYDEDEALLQLDDVEKNKSVIAMIELAGLKFTSQSFSVEFHLKQMMVLKDRNISNRCLIRIQNPTNTPLLAKNSNNPPLSTSTSKNATTTPVNATTSIASPTATATDVTATATDVTTTATDVTTIATDVTATATDAAAASIESSVKTVSKTASISEKPKEEGSLAKMQTDSLDISQNFGIDASKATSSVPHHAEAEEDIMLDQTSHLSANPLEKKITTSLPIHQEPLEKNARLDEINLVPPEDGDTIRLKKPNEVYLEIYKAARRKAKEAKVKAIQAYLEAKRIKTHYLLEEIESSDDDDEFLEDNF